MIQVLLVGADNNTFHDLESVLEDKHISSDRVESGHGALSMISDKTYALVITDETLPDMTGLEFAWKMVTVNPMINCTAISSLSAEDFHEASEGLGLLMQLPVRPEKQHAEALLQHLDNILNITNRSAVQKGDTP